MRQLQLPHHRHRSHHLQPRLGRLWLRRALHAASPLSSSASCGRYDAGLRSCKTASAACRPRPRALNDACTAAHVEGHVWPLSLRRQGAEPPFLTSSASRLACRKYDAMPSEETCSTLQSWNGMAKRLRSVAMCVVIGAGQSHWRNVRSDALETWIRG